MCQQRDTSDVSSMRKREREGGEHRRVFAYIVYVCTLKTELMSSPKMEFPTLFGDYIF